MRYAAKAMPGGTCITLSVQFGKEETAHWCYEFSAKGVCKEKQSKLKANRRKEMMKSPNQ